MKQFPISILCLLCVGSLRSAFGQLLLPVSILSAPWFLSAAERPNVILIMVDDMGFSDLGYHGGEIDTPNLDALARGGVKFSQFYNSGRCCPTRATLMTGLHPHQVGIGHMTQSPNSDRGKDKPPAYQGYLNRQCVTIAEALKPAGYASLMAGKWHLGSNARDRWPLQRGFDKYFGCLAGATRFFHPEAPRDMTFGNEQIENPESTTDEAFYTTDAFTDHGIRFIKEHLGKNGKAEIGKQKSKKPFFLYLAYTAPHWPLQAFGDDIAKYRGKYKMGWDKLREQRLKKQIELGLIDPKWNLSPRTEKIPDWDSLDEKKKDEMDLKMAVYAAMIDRVDQNIGKLINSLKENGAYENTLILFLSDNGGCQEGGMLGRGNFYDIEKRNLESGNSYGEAWANASNTPFRLYKHFAHEGGAATPFFMHWPAGIVAKDGWFSDPAQLIDVMPTILDVAGAKYPQKSHGNNIPALDGISLRPALDAKPLNRANPIFIEHENNAFVRDGDWKLVGRGVATNKGTDTSKWELYNMVKDRTETNDLASANVAKAKELAAKWEAWAGRTKVYPKRNVTGNGTPASAPDTGAPPPVANRKLMISASVHAKVPHGVVLSQGGIMFGWSLHFVKGRPAFSVRNNGQLVELIAGEAVTGKNSLTAELSRKKLRLFVNGKEVASAASPGLLGKQPGIGFFVGIDEKDPVGGYRVPNAFNGDVLDHQVTTSN